MAIPTSYQTRLAELARRVFANDQNAKRQLRQLPRHDQWTVLNIVSRLETARLLYEQKDQHRFYQDRE